MGRGGSSSHRSSGGHRSSHRSSGGRMSSRRSSSRGGSSFSRSTSRSSGSLGTGSGSRPYRGGHFYGGSYGGRRSYGKGCLVGMIYFIIIIGMWLFYFTSIMYKNTGSYNSNYVTKSTIEREALPRGSVNETDYYTDELGWIYRANVLKEGMRNFYNKTGVQPYLYITDTINGTHTPDENDMDTFAQAKYDELFTDEAHILVIFHEYYESEYSIWYVVGNQARSVMDEEACNILMDYLDRYYYTDYEDEEYFSKAFNDAGERIMKVERSPWPYVAGLVVILVIIIILFNWWKKSKQQKNLEAEQTERILNTPLEKFGDKDIDDLTKKYDE